MGNALDKLRTLKNEIASSRNKRDEGGGNGAKEEGESKGVGDTQPAEGEGGEEGHRIEDIDVAEKKDENVSEDKIGDVSENKIGDVTQDKSRDVSKDNSKDVSDDKNKDVAQDKSKDVSEDKSKDVSGDNSKVVPEDKSKDAAAEKAPVEKKMEAEVVKVMFRFISWNLHSYLLLHHTCLCKWYSQPLNGWGGVGEVYGSAQISVVEIYHGPMLPGVGGGSNFQKKVVMSL